MNSTMTILENLMKARARMLDFVNADTCILSTALACEVLRRHSIKAQPFACTVKIFNPYTTLILEKDGYLGCPENHPKAPWYDKDGWSIGLGYPSEGTGWAGHLIAIGDNFLLDLTLDQASRPEKNMNLQPFCLYSKNKSQTGFELFKNGKNILFSRANGCLVVYEFLDNADYLTTPSWQKKDDVEKLITYLGF